MIVVMDNMHMITVSLVVELRELTLYLHQSGIVDLHWHTDHRAYRVNSGLKLMLTILYKCKLLLDNANKFLSIFIAKSLIVCFTEGFFQAYLTSMGAWMVFEWLDLARPSSHLAGNCHKTG